MISNSILTFDEMHPNNFVQTPSPLSAGVSGIIPGTERSAYGNLNSNATSSSQFGTSTPNFSVPFPGTTQNLYLPPQNFPNTLQNLYPGSQTFSPVQSPALTSTDPSTPPSATPAPSTSSLPSSVFKVTVGDIEGPVVKLLKLDSTFRPDVDYEDWVRSFRTVLTSRESSEETGMQLLRISVDNSLHTVFEKASTPNEALELILQFFFPRAHFHLYRNQVKQLRANMFSSAGEYLRHFQSLIKKINLCLKQEPLIPREVEHLFLDNLSEEQIRLLAGQNLTRIEDMSLYLDKVQDFTSLHKGRAEDAPQPQIQGISPNPALHSAMPASPIGLMPQGYPKTIYECPRLFPSSRVSPFLPSYHRRDSEPRGFPSYGAPYKKKRFGTNVYRAEDPISFDALYRPIRKYNNNAGCRDIHYPKNPG